MYSDGTVQLLSFREEIMGGKRKAFGRRLFVLLRLSVPRLPGELVCPCVCVKK